jgi:hypothetical protein
MYKAYSETFNIDILLLTLYTTAHMWGAFGLGADDGAQLTWSSRVPAQNLNLQMFYMTHSFA